jgi:hypothetical protein
VLSEEVLSSEPLFRSEREWEKASGEKSWESWENVVYWEEDGMMLGGREYEELADSYWL